MARPSRTERRPANLQCNECGQQFEGRAWYESIESDKGTMGWVPARGGTSGQQMPAMWI